MDLLEKYILIIEKVCTKIEPGKKMLQKLFYLMERRGVKLDLNYCIHFFGPYSSKLDNALRVLESRDIIIIDTSGFTHKISLGDIKVEAEKLPYDEDKIIDSVINEFSDKSAQELEAVTTLDYVATRLLKNEAEDNKIIEEVKRIKGSKFSEEYLKIELEVLKVQGYIQ